MKFLFIVQGEGRGHLTQAITLEEMLLRNGHEVVEVLVGESSSRILPGFFNRNIQAPVKRFISPNFLPAADNKRANLKKSFTYNLLRIPEYFRSMCYINQRIKETGGGSSDQLLRASDGTYLRTLSSLRSICLRRTPILVFTSEF